MSLKYEQCTAILRSRELLRELLHSPGKRWTKKELRDRAYRCLKHFPMLGENGLPYFSQDEFTRPDGGMIK
jgi:hypothetical protein